MCTMAINQELNGIELTFEGKPAEEIREAMKAAGFRWHRMKKLWYAKNTADRMELAEKLSGSSAAPGTDSGSKKIRTGFKVRHQSWRHPDRLMGIRTNKRGVLSGNKDHQRLQNRNRRTWPYRNGNQQCHERLCNPGSGQPDR